MFGAHVSLVIRRLRRLAAAHGATPAFVGASATIANPVELAELEKLRADFPAWVFNAVHGRWIAEKHLEDGLIIIEKRDPKSLRTRVEFYENPGDVGASR